MADTTPSPPTPQGAVAADTSAKSPRPARLSKYQQLNQLYALPAPLRTFPLPAFIPHNPLSLFHIVYAWVSQTIHPTSSNFEPLYQGWFSAETRSVHVTDVRSMRGLWEQGFYGKGSLSRSEPNWLNREKLRSGTQSKVTSEELTRRRRAERQQVKWERARREREAIELKLLEEEEAALTIELKLLQEEQAAWYAKRNTSEPFPVTEMAMDSSSLVLNDDRESLNISISKLSLCPVGPMELLSLPNSAAELLPESKGAKGSLDNFEVVSSTKTPDLVKQPVTPKVYIPPVGPLEILALPNSIETSLPTDTGLIDESIETLVADVVIDDRGKDDILPEQEDVDDYNGSDFVNGLGVNGHTKTETPLALDNINVGVEVGEEVINGSPDSGSFDAPNGTAKSPSLANGHSSCRVIKRQKSVRFSPTVEQNTFLQSEPPSPERTTEAPIIDEEPAHIKEQEHTQLTLEEAFFLSYGLGAISILDPATNSTLSNERLFNLFRKTSRFPPLSNPSLSPDDPFMVNYVVYHHFRSIGWVPRSGIKFSVDYLLYNRGPVFSHAEFGVIILPSYDDPYWSSTVMLQNHAKQNQRRTWAWMNCINRVITQVKKTLIIVYVDIPKPLTAEEEAELGIDGVLSRYKIREFVMKRWLATRSRG
ncbi:uncharacterized protein BP5553_03058 [Venustampulla echinocandica]|uniref:tRNA-intron lyase n=1 Tax=Venustampulla echinocandica TaxID=2656787 RepID=A0A370TTA5_9HELO|nr:uncharacterized protein BP5553_03058 [Venustampulla echinocandica]RDL38718.1 hypothetical protein BP5553_03058 [Venustampulla echinocandica]